MSQPLLSIVSPVYQAVDLIDELVDKILQNISQITKHFEIVLVEDGSQDGSWEKIEEQCKNNAQIKGIRLSRNFGQHSAVIAGLRAAMGEWIVIMDCDLQDRPEEVVRLYRKAKEGYDVVFAGRMNRQHSFFKRFLSKSFYKVLSMLSGTHYDSRVANFGIYHRKVINAVLEMKENIPYFTAMVNWVGFKRTILPVEHAARPRGKSSYNFKRLVKLAIDALLAYSDKPLKLIIGLGASISLLAFIFGSYIIYKYLSGQIIVSGYTSLSVTICFFSGLIILVLGIIGLYIGKIFEGIKNRPTYLVRERINLEPPPSSTKNLPYHSEATSQV
jgi:dolichol-phosphate mannosyltransferase